MLMVTIDVLSPTKVPRMTSIGTIAMSCAIRMPMASRPRGVSSSPLLRNIDTTTAVLLKLIAKPMSNMRGNGQSSHIPIAKEHARLAPICNAVPPTETRQPLAR